MRVKRVRLAEGLARLIEFAAMRKAGQKLIEWSKGAARVGKANVNQTVSTVDQLGRSTTVKTGSANPV